MKFGSGWSWLKILPLWIALMSGVLSIFRESYGMFAANPVDPKSIFWECARIAFILAAGFAWWQEHQEVQRLKAAAKQTRSLKEEHAFQLAKACIERHGADCVAALRHINQHGSATPSTIPDRSLPLMDALVEEGLVEQNEIDHKIVWTITPGMQAALEQLLYL